MPAFQDKARVLLQSAARIVYRDGCHLCLSQQHQRFLGQRPEHASIYQQACCTALDGICQKIMAIAMLSPHCHKHLSRQQLARIMVEASKLLLLPGINEVTLRRLKQVIKQNHI